MGAVYFYHLTRHPLETTLAMLLGKAQATGWRTLVRGQDRARLEWLDQKLWLGPEEDFLPHGLSGGPHDALQPILLTETREVPNAPQCIMSIDGAELTREDVATLERACILFDGHDETAVAHARTQWKTLTDAGTPATYWSEEAGRWEKKAEAT